jgi:hypothetical protein
MSRRGTSSFRRDFERAAHQHGLDHDPLFARGSSLRSHLRDVSAPPGSAGRRGWAAREWNEFAGFQPNMLKSLNTAGMSGTYPGVRVDQLFGVTVESGQSVVIDGTKKSLYLCWPRGGRRFMLVGSPESMQDLARGFSRLAEQVMLTRVDYVAPRYPVAAGERRTQSNKQMSIAFTHQVENPTVIVWNGKLDATAARFDVRVKAPSRRWVNRSGLIF